MSFKVKLGRKNSKFFIITNRSGVSMGKKQRIESRKYRKIDHVSCVQQAMTKQTFFFLMYPLDIPENID